MIPKSREVSISEESWELYIERLALNGYSPPTPLDILLALETAVELDIDSEEAAAMLFNF